ncbi:hypothetical protein [Intestinimonas butyriciproducens]|uniref:hypothetical protein n=1 Tax=Intestinimonas butyriciproducens TaxID=1297617 RepID=UPI00242D48C6|nr:hypothetical protein [Intestinimonas butyriciproducens]MCI6362866.1 hypothetical protein [Intestinimonas butyriciproducens]
MRKHFVRTTLSMFLLVSIFAASLAGAHAAQVEPRYAGISDIKATLSISSSGGAKCKGTAEVNRGYTVDLTVELKQDGETINTWTDSGTGMVSTGGTYYVTSGHDYVVTTTAEVKDSNGRIVETPSKDSPVKSF